MLDRHSFNWALQEKWIHDRVALEMDPVLQRMHETIHRVAYRNLARFPDLIFPRNYNDRLHWLMLFDQQKLMVDCSDKVRVREFFKDRVGEEHVVKLLGVYSSVDDIDPSSLPKSCVIKANHDSGTVFALRDTTQANFDDIWARLRRSLSSHYGGDKGEWAYPLIEPAVVIEEHLCPAEEKPPPDFKFHCVEGRVAFIQYIFDRGIATKELLLDTDWKRLPIYFDQNFIWAQDTPPKPSNLDELCDIAARLSRGFKYVRVDLYNIQGRVVCGEMTFFPRAGTYKGYGSYQVEPYMRFDLNIRRPPVSDGCDWVKE